MRASGDPEPGERRMTRCQPVTTRVGPHESHRLKMIVGRAIARVERDDENHRLTLGQGSFAKCQRTRDRDRTRRPRSRVALPETSAAWSCPYPWSWSAWSSAWSALRLVSSAWSAWSLRPSPRPPEAWFWSAWSVGSMVQGPSNLPRFPGLWSALPGKMPRLPNRQGTL